MIMAKNKNEKYSECEKRAFFAGKAYAIAKAGNRVNCKSSVEKQSFRNGVNSVRKGAVNK